MLRDLLLRLVTPTADGEPVRSRVPRRTVATDAEHERLIELLVRARLVTSDDDIVELAHEASPAPGPGCGAGSTTTSRASASCATSPSTADAWDGMGRPDSELYRGVRLAQALEWQTRADPDLTPVERAFLDTSAERQRAEDRAAEERVRQQARQNRRLRTLLAGAAVLLVVSMVAGRWPCGRRSGPTGPRWRPTPAESAPRPSSLVTSTDRCCSRRRGCGSTTRPTPGPT